MPVSEKFQRLHMSASVVSSTVAILSALIAGVAYFRTGDFQRLVDDTKQLELRLAFVNPKNGTDVQGTPVPWTGRVEVRSPNNSVLKGNVTVELSEKGIQIVPLVRPVAAENLWWAQSAATIDSSGTLGGVLNFGDLTGRGIGTKFQVVLISVKAGAVKQGETYADLPRHTAESPVATVTRTK